MGRDARHEGIIHLVSKMREVSVQYLVERFGVSEATIRKDLTFLEEMGYLVRTHGGAILAEDRNQEIPLSQREQRNLQEKLSIVKQAKTFIHEGDTIFIDSGSTCRLLAREIRDMTVRVICHSLGVYEELKTAPNLSLFALGGSYRKDAESFIGPIAVDNLKYFQIQTCFIGTASFSDKGIFAAQNIIEAQLKAEVLRVSRRRIILADHTKYNTFGFSVFARPGDVDILITDQAFPDRDTFLQLGIEVLLA
ncbi:MAG: DeoR/GlpR family DNA-binding transcription regulator [Spirochaetales bacterium]